MCNVFGKSVQCAMFLEKVCNVWLLSCFGRYSFANERGHATVKGELLL